MTELTIILICGAYAIGWFHGSYHEMRTHKRWIAQHLADITKSPADITKSPEDV